MIERDLIIYRTIIGKCVDEVSSWFSDTIYAIRGNPVPRVCFLCPGATPALSVKLDTKEFESPFFRCLCACLDGFIVIATDGIPKVGNQLRKWSWLHVRIAIAPDRLDWTYYKNKWTKDAVFCEIKFKKKTNKQLKRCCNSESKTLLSKAFELLPDWFSLLWGAGLNVFVKDGCGQGSGVLPGFGVKLFWGNGIDVEWISTTILSDKDSLRLCVASPSNHGKKNAHVLEHSQ